MISITGDVHGEIIKRFSYRQYPELRFLTEDDYVIVLGDFGCPWFNPTLEYYDYWTKPGSEKEDHYQLNFLNNKPWTTIVICGNHDNYDLVHQMPIVDHCGARLRQCMYNNVEYNNILYVDTPQIVTFNNTKILAIPGAESHDADYIFDWDDPETKKKAKYLDREYEKGRSDLTYRINHFSWWEDEIVSEQVLQYSNETVDYVLSHDCPAVVLKDWKFKNLKPSRSEELLEQLRQNIQYKTWFHGHLHNSYVSTQYKTSGLYKEFCILTS